MNGKDFFGTQKSQRFQRFTPDEGKRRRIPRSYPQVIHRARVIHRLSTEGTYPHSIHNHANHAGNPITTSLKDQKHKDGNEGSDSDASDSDSDSDSDAYSSDAYGSEGHACMLYSSESQVENQ